MHLAPLRRLLVRGVMSNARTVLGVRSLVTEAGKTRHFNSASNLNNLPRSSGHWKWPTTNIRDPRARGGSRMWYPPVNTEEDARNLALNLDPTGRKLLMDQLKIISEKKDETTVVVEPLSSSELYKVFLINCLPFIGFGFLDNGIMIIAGEYIDIQLGFFLGISTMAAAALGNLISDLAGVGTAGYIENMVEKFSSIQPNLSPAQFHFRAIRWMTAFGRAIGITIGCLLGMLPLLLFDHSKDKTGDSPKREKEKSPLIQAVVPEAMMVANPSIRGGSQ